MHLHTHFTGKERDPESGNDYFGARYYNSATGRWLSPDPVVVSPSPERPQTWNKYSYVFNDPLGSVDPDGRWPFWIHNMIYDFAFSGVYSSKEIGVIQHESLLMDFRKGQQAPSAANTHGMCQPGQTTSECDQGVANFVDNAFYDAGHSTGNLSLQFEADGLHTVTDIASPMHVGADGHGIVWNDGFFEGLQHESGEISITGNVYGIGQGIRNSIEFDALLHPDHAKAQGGLSAWEYKAVTSFADSLALPSPATSGIHDESDEAKRQCALGNKAGCN